MKKYLIHILISLAGFVAGLATEKATRGTATLSCPDYPKCPDALLQVQTLDMEALKKIRGGFTYSPTYSGTIVFCDTLPPSK